MATSRPHKPQSAALRMADGGSFSQMFREKVFGAPKGYVPAAKVAAPAPAPAPAPAQPPAKAITDYSSGSATQRRMTALGLKDGGDLKTGQGGNVPGSGKGDKIPAKYEPGEFVVSNAMLEADPELRAELQALRERVLASQGKTVEETDAGAMGEEFQAVDGGEREKRTAFPTNIPARSPYSTQGNPVREFGDAASRMVAAMPAPARAADGSMAGPGVTPYQPYRMAGFNRPAPAARPTPAAAMAAPTPIPAVGTMPTEEVQGTSVNPVARAAGAVSSSLAAGFPAARQAYADANTATLDAAQRGDYAAAAGQAVRGAVVAPVMAAGDVIGGVAGTLANVAKPVAQFGYTAVTGDSTPLFQDDPRSTNADTPAAKNPASDQGQSRPGAASAPGARPAGTGSRSANNPNRTDVDPTDQRFGAARDFSKELAGVPRDLPSDMRDGVILKTKDENGRTVYSGRNVGENAQMVDGMGRQTASRGSVSTVPGMAKEEIAKILARPLDPRTAMTPDQRFQYDKEVQNAQGINNFNAGYNKRGTTVSDMLRSGMERRALANENARGEITSRQQQDQSRSAADVLAQRRQDESEANSSVTRRTGEVEAQGAEQIQALRTQLLEAETPEERNSVAKKLQALSGKETQNRYTTIAGGSSIDPATGAVLQRPGMVLDNSTGRLVDLGSQQGGAQPQTSPYPDGTRLTGPDGKIYTVKNGQPTLVTE